MPHRTSLLIVIFLMACSTKKKVSDSKDCLNFSFLKLCETHCIKTLKSGIDGELGVVQCQNYHFDYEVSRSAYEGPEDHFTYFVKAFRNYHYTKFFDFIHIDKKVQKLFRDSVRIMEVMPIAAGSDLNCKNCNRKALLKFKNTNYPYAYVVSKELDDKLNSIHAVYYDLEDYNIRLYTSENENGLFATPSLKDKTADKISFQLRSGDINTFIEKMKNNLSIIEKKK